MSGVTVLRVEEVRPEREGPAAVRRFLTAETVGARVVEGMAYELPPRAGVTLADESGRHQLVYVTAGLLEGLYAGERHELAPGRGVYCEPGETCVLRNAGDAPARFYRFLVTPT